MIYNLKAKKKIYPALIILMIFCAVFTTSCRTISTKSYEISSPLINKGNSIIILLISDLHSSIHGKEQASLIKKIVAINPDLIILSGDVFDSTYPMYGVELLLAGISGIAPIYFVTGNHEYWSGNIHKIRDILLSHGVIILSDSYLVIEVNNNKLVLAGIEDPDREFFDNRLYNQRDSMEKAFRELDYLPAYKILIAHRPENIKVYREFSFDLVLSGHTHGGQVRFLFINGLYARNQGLFPKYAGGIYTHDNMTHIISRGLSLNYPRFPRIFNSPELVVIRLE